MLNTTHRKLNRELEMIKRGLNMINWRLEITDPELIIPVCALTNVNRWLENIHWKLIHIKYKQLTGKQTLLTGSWQVLTQGKDLLLLANVCKPVRANH